MSPLPAAGQDTIAPPARDPSASGGAPPASPVRGGGSLMLALFLVSGASGLVYQVVWSRSLTLVFGSTTQGVATVLAAFMGGLALGAWLGSKIGDRLGSPLRSYGLLEGGIALLSLLVLFMMPALDRIYPAIYGWVHLSLPGLTLVRLVLAGVFLLPPTTLMGATLPVLSACFERRGAVAGQGASILYAFNTIGAVAGAAGAGFVLLPSLGMTQTTLLAAGGNLVAALGALLLSKLVEEQGRSVQIPFAPGPERPGAAAPVHEEALPPAVIAGVAAAIAVSGVGALVLEVCWTRTLSLVFGSSTHAFTLMLTTFLVGLAAGSAIAGRLLGRVRDPVGAFAVVEIGAGLAVFAGTFLFPELPYGFLLVYEATRGSPGWFDAGRFALAASIMLVPTLLLGATFPLAVRCARMGAAQAAQPVGFLYSVNTLGAIAGSLAAGFLLIPFAGLEQTLIVGALVSVTIGAFLLTLASGASRAVRWVLASALFLLLPALPVGAPRWNPVLMTSGIFQYAPKIAEMVKSRAQFLTSHTLNNQLFYRDGMTATVTVEKRPSRGDGKEWLVLTVNGKVDASTVGDMETQVLLGHLPVLIAKNPRHALVVGWGSGITAGSLLTHPEIESVRAVEIEPAVIQASTYFHKWNGKPEADPRLTLEINDARHDMLVDPRRYDVIISEPSNPWLSGPARLFTREFFEMARAHLAPGGLLCQWVQMYGLDVDSYLTLLRTLSEVFDDVMVFRGSPGDTIVLAGTAPISLDLATIHNRLQVPAVAADLRKIHVTDLPTLLSHFRAGGDALRALVGPGRLNTDDNAYIEFAAARSIYQISDIAIDALLLSASSSPLDAADLTGLSERTRERMPLLMAREWMGQGLLPRARAALAHARAGAPLSPDVAAEADALRADILERTGDDAQAKTAWRSALERDPGDLEALVSLGRSLREEEGALPESLELLERAIKSHPRSARARLELARSLRAAGRPREAIETLKAVGDAPPSQAPFIEMEWGRACYAMGDLDCAVRRIGLYFKEWRGVPKPAQTSVDAALDLGRAWLAKGDRAKALEQFKVAAGLGDNLATWYRGQADQALKAGKPEAAERDWRHALEWSPLDPRAYYALGDHLAVSGRWDDALEIWRSLIDRRPDDVHGLSGAVTALDNLGRSRETAPYIEHLISVAMNADTIAALRARLASLKAGEASGSD